MIQVAAITGAAAFSWLVLFQLMLAAGLPLGRMAWGGQSARLNPAKRWASAVSMLLVALGALACLQAGGYIDILPGPVLRPLLWALAALFALSFVGNAMSASRIERLHGVPVTILCAGSCLILALGF